MISQSSEDRLAGRTDAPSSNSLELVSNTDLEYVLVRKESNSRNGDMIMWSSSFDVTDY